MSGSEGVKDEEKEESGLIGHRPRPVPAAFPGRVGGQIGLTPLLPGCLTIPGFPAGPPRGPGPPPPAARKTNTASRSPAS